MKFVKTPLPGLVILEQERHVDPRGYFARTWCKDELAAQGLVNEIAQSSVSFNARRGTLRGMHYQAPPFAETKLVRCIRGGIFDVAVDLRPSSPAFRKWTGVELTADNRRALYIPAGCAHGLETLTPDAEVLYMIDAPYSAAHGRGVRWNDPAFGIQWPRAVELINERDAAYPDFS